MTQKTYEYTEILPNGDIIHGNNGKYMTQKQRDDLNEIMSRAWDALTDEKRREINQKMELKYRKEAAI